MATPRKYTERLHPRTKIKGHEGEYAEKLDLPDWLSRVSDQLVGAVTGTKTAAKKAGPAKKAPAKAAKATKAAAKKAAPGFAEKLDAQALARSMVALDDREWLAKLRAMDGPQRARVLDATTAVELKRRAKGAGLPATGTKAGLVERLDDHVQGKTPPAAPAAKKTARAAPSVPVASLQKGDRARVQGHDQSGQPMTLTGFVLGPPTPYVRGKGSRNEETLLGVQMAETPSGANGWRGVVYTTPDAMAHPGARRSSFSRDVEPPGRAKAGPSLEDQARKRHAEIQKATAVAKALTEVDELLDSEVDDQVLRRRINTQDTRFGTPNTLRARLLAAIGDRKKLRAVVDRAASAAKLTPIDEAGAPARMDPKRHQSIDGRTIPAGSPVVVVRRGYVWKRPGGDEVRLDKAVVERSDEQEYQRLTAEREPAKLTRGNAAAVVAGRLGTLERPAPASGDGLDDLQDHQLRSLATEFEVPDARTASREKLLAGLRKAGAKSPYLDRPAAPAPAASKPDGPQVRRVWHGFDMGPGVAQQYGRTGGDEPLYLPNGGADQGLVHLDSQLGTLWQDLVADNREPNSFVNAVARIGEDVGTGTISLDQAANRLRGLSASATDQAVIRRIDATIRGITEPTPAPSIDVPSNVPPSIRLWLEDLAQIPTMRKTALPGNRRDQSVLDEALALVREISQQGISGQRTMSMGQAEMRLLGITQNVHESIDGVYHARRLTGRTFSSESSDWPEIRDWLQGRSASPAKNATAPSASQLRQQLVGAKTGDERLALLHGLKLSQADARRLARELGVKGQDRSTADQIIPRIAEHFVNERDLDERRAASDAAIARQRRIDTARPAGRLAAELAELHSRLRTNEIPDAEAADTLGQRLEGAIAQARADRRRDGVLPAGLDEAEAAARSRNVDRMQAAIAALAAANGITLDGRPLDTVTLDRSKHSPVGNVPDGEQVTVMRPGVVFRDPETGERIQLEKAVVAKVDPKMLAAARKRVNPAKKAAPKRADTPGVSSFDGRPRSAWMADARKAGITVPRGAPAHEVARLVGEHHVRRAASDSYALRFGGRDNKPGDPSYDMVSGKTIPVPTREEYIDAVMARERASHNAKLAAHGLAPYSDIGPQAGAPSGAVRLEPAPTVFGNVTEAHRVMLGDTDVGTVYVGTDGITVFPPSGHRGRGAELPRPPSGATVEQAAQMLVDFHEAESKLSPVDRARRHVGAIVPEYGGPSERLLETGRASIMESFGHQAELAPATTLSLDGVEFAPATAGRGGMFGWGWGESARYDQFSRRIRMSPDWRTDWGRVSQASRDGHASGWFTPTPNPGAPAASAAHEFGHHVVKTIGFSGFDAKQSAEIYGALERALGLPKGTLYKSGTPDKDTINRRLAPHSDIIRERISGYAAQPSGDQSSQLDELLAEVWQEYSMMGEQARPHIKEIGEIMARLAEEAAQRDH